MNILTFIENTAAILELVFFILTMYSLVTGLKTKNYDNLKKGRLLVGYLTIG